MDLNQNKGMGGEGKGGFFVHWKTGKTVSQNQLTGSSSDALFMRGSPGSEWGQFGLAQAN